MIKISELESAILKVIKRWRDMYQNNPNVTELAEELKCPVGRADYAVEQLVKKGFLDLVYPNVGRRRLIVVLYWE